MKISLDAKTIQKINVSINEYLNIHLGKCNIISDCFTMYDLKNGYTKRLLIKIGKKTIYIYAGKNLSEKDFTAHYDSFGSIKTKVI